MTKPRIPANVRRQSALALWGAAVVLAPGNAAAQDVADTTATVVEHLSLQPPGLAQWTVEPDPLLTIGVVQGQPSQVFTSIVGVVQRSDGVIVIADAAAHEVRAFSSEGVHLWSAGAPGQGPGEFNERIQLLGLLPGDSVLVAEEGRATVFGPEGRTARTIPLRPLADNRLLTRVVGVLGDGTLVATSQQPLEQSFGVTRPWLHVDYLDPSASTVLRDIDRVQAAPRHRSQVQVPGPSGEIVTAWAIESVPFAPQEQIAVGHEHTAVGSQNEFEIRVYTVDGDLMTVLRAEPPLEPTDLDRFLEESPFPPSAAARRSQVDRSIVPSTLPRFGDVLFDSEERLWVQEYMPSYAVGVTEWWVFETDGELVARASLPESFTPHVMTASHLIGVWQDALDVPYVQVLARTAEPSG